MAPNIPITGGCLCGFVRYEAAAAPIGGYYCHCKMCQKNYGGLYQATVRFAGTGFAFTKGKSKYYRSSAFGRRGFCPDCGSPIAFVYEGNSDFWILLGSLDHPEDWPLTKEATWGVIEHVCVESKVPWYSINDGLRQKRTDEVVTRTAAIDHTDRTPKA